MYIVGPLTVLSPFSFEEENVSGGYPGISLNSGLGEDSGTT
jgi:hypothetical protein